MTHEIADELERVGGEILGGVNKSKTFRVMVAYFAAVHKLKTPTRPTSVSSLSVHIDGGGRVDAMIAEGPLPATMADRSCSSWVLAGGFFSNGLPAASFLLALARIRQTLQEAKGRSEERRVGPEC